MKTVSVQEEKTEEDIQGGLKYQQFVSWKSGKWKSNE